MDTRTQRSADEAPEARVLDLAQLESLFRAYHGPLCTFVYRMVYDRAAAEDLVQDLFLKVWHQTTHGTASASRAYLYAAARHGALNYLRQQRYRDQWITPAGAESPDAAAERTPADETQYHDLHRVVQQAIAALPARAREVLTLRRDHELSVEEIATALGITPKTAENHLTRAIRALRTAINQRWG